MTFVRPSQQGIADACHARPSQPGYGNWWWTSVVDWCLRKQGTSVAGMLNLLIPDVAFPMGVSPDSTGTALVQSTLQGPRTCTGNFMPLHPEAQPEAVSRPV